MEQVVSVVQVALAWAASSSHDRQVVEAERRIRVGRAEHRLADRQGPAIERLGAVQVAGRVPEDRRRILRDGMIGW